MGEQATPGMHNGSPIERRITKLERILSPFRAQKLIAKTLDGTPGTFNVLASNPYPAASEAEVLPFAISVTSSSLIAAAGTVNGDNHAIEINESMSSGTWYFRAKVTINSSTGSITSTDVAWTKTEASNTTTEFYKTIGNVDVINGKPDPATIEQHTYGPMLVVVYGTPTDKWGVTIY